MLAVVKMGVMACCARMFGGLRTGYLHALRWEALDAADGAFTWGLAPRAKTKRPQRLPIPDLLRPILRDWWERAGRPGAGPVFPNLRDGKRAKAGETARHGDSHATAFRRDLRRAFGLDVLVEERVTKPDKRCSAGEREIVVRRWEQAREMTPRERELFVETEWTKPVDFHSWRRAFVQALADAGVTAQQAQALAGHANLGAHERYLRSSVRTLTMPAEALPRLLFAMPESDPIAVGSGSDSSLFSARQVAPAANSSLSAIRGRANRFVLSTKQRMVGISRGCWGFGVDGSPCSRCPRTSGGVRNRFQLLR